MLLKIGLNTKKRTEGVNIWTLHKIIVAFNQIMNCAVRHRYVDHNPVRNTERPKIQGNVDDHKIRFLSPEQINAFLDAVKCPKHRMLFLLAVMSGARQGELLGLKRTDIDDLTIRSTYRGHIIMVHGSG